MPQRKPPKQHRAIKQNIKFVGRKEELAILEEFKHRKIAALLVIKGRRRIGKSRLIEEFAKDEKFYSFAGIAPTEKTTAQSQRDEFARQLSITTGLPEITADDWSKLFILLANVAQQERVIIFFDEISWMGDKDPDFLGKLKNAWDLYLKKNPQLILILCGSASSWIEKNIINSTGFLGRIAHITTLEELPLHECLEFWGAKVKNLSSIEILKILSITGGVPRYLEEINPNLSAEENIKNLCFRKGALLVEEFNNIFATTFLRNSTIYRKITELLATGDKEFSTICQNLHLTDSGRISEYLDELVLAGFIKRDYTWHIKSGHDAKLSKYRLSDNYLRFYLKYIDKYKEKIARNLFAFKSLAALPGWETIIALQFENLVLNNCAYLWQLLKIKPEDIISANPFFQRKTSKQPGCQIDYMIQTRFSVLYICEIKFSSTIIPVSIIEEVQQKIDRLKRPPKFSCRPVLIHVNGVHKDVTDCDYFSAIIDFAELLNKKR